MGEGFVMVSCVAIIVNVISLGYLFLRLSNQAILK